MELTRERGPDVQVDSLTSEGPPSKESRRPLVEERRIPEEITQLNDS